MHHIGDVCHLLYVLNVLNFRFFTWNQHLSLTNIGGNGFYRYFCLSCGQLSLLTLDLFSFKFHHFLSLKFHLIFLSLFFLFGPLFFAIFHILISLNSISDFYARFTELNATPFSAFLANHVGNCRDKHAADACL